MHIVDCARERRSEQGGQGAWRGKSEESSIRQNPDTICSSQRSPENTSGRDCVVVFCFCLLAIFKDTLTFKGGRVSNSKG